MFVEGKRTRIMQEVDSMPGRLGGGWKRGKVTRVKEKNPDEKKKNQNKEVKKGRHIYRCERHVADLVY